MHPFHGVMVKRNYTKGLKEDSMSNHREKTRMSQILIFVCYEPIVHAKIYTHKKIDADAICSKV